MTTAHERDTRPPLPWWRVKMMWLVLGGPALVVVAGVATMVIAVRGADTVLSTQQQQPAVQARNHAATPQR